MSGKTSKSTRKIILISVITALLCFAFIAVVLAVTLSGKSEQPHIKIEEGESEVRGELDISLMREKLETLTLDKDGMPVRGKDENLTDFSKTNENIFGIKDDMIIAPECYFKADMAISNKKPYAFEYWLEIIPENGKNLLADQLELTVEIEGQIFIRRTLRDGLETKVFPEAESGKTERFTVTLKYINAQDNDETKNTTLAFDMTVHARLTES